MASDAHVAEVVSETISELFEMLGRGEAGYRTCCFISHISLNTCCSGFLQVSMKRVQSIVSPGPNHQVKFKSGLKTLSKGNILALFFSGFKIGNDFHYIFGSPSKWLQLRLCCQGRFDKMPHSLVPQIASNSVGLT